LSLNEALRCFDVGVGVGGGGSDDAGEGGEEKNDLDCILTVPK